MGVRLEKTKFADATKLLRPAAVMTLEMLDTEVKDVNSRLAVLYDAIETGKLDLNDLAPGIKELKARQDELLKSRVLLEADMAVQGVQYVDAPQGI